MVESMRWWTLAFYAAAMFATAVALEPLAVEVKSIGVAEVATDRVKLSVHLGGTAGYDAVVRQIAFDGVTLNGVPVFVPSLPEPLRLVRGKPYTAAVEATVLYRDLPSLDPVRRMVREGKVRVNATVRLQPDLSLVQKLALRTWSPWVSVKIDRTVDVEVPGGSMGRTTALVVLAGADSVWSLGQRGLEWRRERDEFIAKVRSDYAPRVVMITTKYRLADGEGQWTGLGFHWEGHEVIAPAEAAEPWLFDAGMADAIAARAVEVGEVTIAARTAAGAAMPLTLVHVARETEKGLSVGRRKTYRFRERASASNLARFRTPSKAEAVKQGKMGDDVAIFRLLDGVLEILVIAAVVENGNLRLADPVDSRAYGSPVIGRDGFLGILQDQRTILRVK
jgi:hypothetical protein